MKRDLVAADEFDRGSRQLLNLGHTFGHAVEACSGYTVPHGCGVAIGMAIIARAAARRGICTDETCAQILALLRQYGLPTETDFAAMRSRMPRVRIKDRRRGAAPHCAGAHRLLPHRDGPGGGHPRMARGRRHRMNQTVLPGPRTGSVRIPASKSQAHRLLICAALGAQPVALRCDGISADIAATVRCLRALGADITDDGAGTLHIVPIAGEMPEHADLFCGESGSTLRFLLPVAGALGADVTFHMEGRLPQRPLAPLDAVLAAHGMTLRRDGALLHAGGQLRPGDYALPGDVSSQYISGLLMALPRLAGESTLTVTGGLESAGYIAMTEDALRLSGIRLKKDARTYTVPGGQTAQLPAQCRVEDDWSNAAFFLCMGALSPAGITVTGLAAASSQGTVRCWRFCAASARMCTCSRTPSPYGAAHCTAS